MKLAATFIDLVLLIGNALHYIETRLRANTITETAPKTNMIFNLVSVW